MTLLGRAVKFRLLIDELNDTEFSQFILKVIQTQRQFILKSLFNSFINRNNQNDINIASKETNQFLNIIIHTVSTIIQSRETKPDENTKVSNIHELPHQLIAEIASNLDQYEYIHFSRCNRRIYVGCNTPNVLHKLDLLSINNYSLINIANYPSIRSLFLRINDFDELKLFPETVTNKLQKLRLDMNLSDNDITSFLQQTTIHMNNLNNVSFESFGSVDHPFDGDLFYKLLTSFPVINCLRLMNITINHNNNSFNATKIKQLFPNVKGLLLLGTNIHTAMLNALGEKLEFLMIDSFAGNNFGDLLHTNFKELRKLVAVLPTVHGLNCILKTAQNLTDINIAPKLFDNQMMTDSEMKHMMSTIFVQFTTLHGFYIGIDADKFGLMVDAIEYGLYRTRKCHRNEFKIWFNMNYSNCNAQQIQHQEFVIYLSRIVNALSTSNIDEFAVIWEFGFDDVDKRMQYQKEVMQEVEYFIETSSDIKLIESTTSQTVIGNVNCKMTNFVKYWNCFGSMDITGV